MDPDDEYTFVVYRRWRKKDTGRGIIALFPGVIEDAQRRHCSCYEHVGQHSAASYWHVLSQTKPVALDHPDVLELQNELVEYGYRLLPRLRYNYRRPPQAPPVLPSLPIHDKVIVKHRITKREAPSAHYDW